MRLTSPSLHQLINDERGMYFKRRLKERKHWSLLRSVWTGVLLVAWCTVVLSGRSIDCFFLDPFLYSIDSQFAVMYNLMLVIARIAFKQLKEFDIVFGKF